MSFRDVRGRYTCRVSPGNSRRRHAQFPLAIEVGGVSRISRDTHRDFSELTARGVKREWPRYVSKLSRGDRQFAAADLPAGHHNFVDSNNGNNGRPLAPQRAVNPPASRFFALSLTTPAVAVYRGRGFRPCRFNNRANRAYRIVPTARHSLCT